MPKISEAGGPTDESQPGYYELGRSPQSPNVTATDTGEGEDVSAGNSSPTSNGPRSETAPTGKPASPSTAPTTGGRSNKMPTERFTARSTGGSGTADRSGKGRK